MGVGGLSPRKPFIFRMTGNFGRWERSFVRKTPLAVVGRGPLRRIEPPGFLECRPQSQELFLVPAVSPVAPPRLSTCAVPLRAVSAAVLNHLLPFCFFLQKSSHVCRILGDGGWMEVASLCIVVHGALSRPVRTTWLTHVSFVHVP